MAKKSPPLVVLFSFIFSFLLQSQSPSFDWVVQPNRINKSGGANEVLDSQIDEAGNIYLLGKFTGAQDFDLSEKEHLITSVGGERYYLVKYSVDNELLWVKQFGVGPTGSKQHLVLGNSASGDSAIFVVGQYVGAGDFDSGESIKFLSAELGTNTFISKLSVHGEYLWTVDVGNDFNVVPAGIAADSNHLYIALNFSDSLHISSPNFEAHNVSKGSTDVGMLKISYEGELEFFKAIGGPGTDRVNDLSTSPLGGFFITGGFNSVMDFNPGDLVYAETCNGISDGYIAEYTVDGDLNSVNIIGGVGAQEGEMIHVDESGIYLAARVSGFTDYDITESENVKTVIESNLMIAKYASDRSLQWESTTKNAVWVSLNDFLVAKNGSVFITGDFIYGAQFHASRNELNFTGSAVSDAFALAYGPAGDIDWAFALQSNGRNYGNTVSFGKDSALFLGGSYSKDLDFNHRQVGNFTLEAKSGAEGFFALYNPVNSNLIDAKNIGGYAYNYDLFDAIADQNTTKKNELIKCANYKGEWDFDEQDSSIEASSDNINFVLTKYDPSGKHMFSLTNKLGQQSRAECREVELDENDNIYAAGEFSGQVTFGSTKDSISYDIGLTRAFFVAKYNPGGELLWVKKFGEMGASRCLAFDVHHSGAYSFVGAINSSADFDPSENTYAVDKLVGSTAVLASYDKNGDLNWAGSLAGVYGDVASVALILDDSLNSHLYAVLRDGEYDFSAQGPTTRIGSDEISGLTSQSVLAKIDDQGNNLWVKSLSGEINPKMELDNDGDLFFLTGVYDTLYTANGNINIKGGSFNGKMAVHALQFDRDGSLKSQTELPNLLSENGSIEFTLNDSNDIFITGFFSGTVDFDQHKDSVLEKTSLTGSSLYLLKMDKNLDLKWVETMHSTAGVYPLRISTGFSEGLFLLGLYGGELAVDPSGNTKPISRVVSSSFGVYTAKYSTCDIPVSEFILPEELCRGEAALIQLPSSEIDVEYFISKLSSSNIIDAIQVGNGGSLSFQIPAVSQNGKYILHAKGASCATKTLIELDIFDLPNLSITQNLNELRAGHGRDLTFQWVNCDDNFSLIAGETDSVFSPITAGNYALVYSSGACSDTTACYNYTPNGIEELDSYISVFPNPFNAEISLKFKFTEKKSLKLSLTDVSGKILLVEEIDISKATKSVNTMALAPGMYILKIENEEGEQKQVKLLKH